MEQGLIWMEFDNDKVFIGKEHGWGKEFPVGLDVSDRSQHLYVIGQTGTGKSTLLRNMILQDIEAGPRHAFRTKTIGRPDSGRIHGTKNQWALLTSLFESRVMTSKHISVLCFDGKGEAAKKRLGKLKNAGLVNERPRKSVDPAVLFLTRKAFALLNDKGVLANYPKLDSTALEKRSRVSELTLKHELEIMDVKAAIHSALKRTKAFTIQEFSTWPLLYQFEAFRAGYGGEEVLVKPDGFIRIHEKEEGEGASEHSFFLEVDRSTETQETLVARAGCYLDYYKSGGFAVWNGAERSAFRDYPFRVLMVFKSAERRNNIAERLIQNKPPILSMACLATLEEVRRDPLGSIWMRPADYRDTTKGTPFDVENKRPSWNYKRQTARDDFIEKHVRKFGILDTEDDE